MASAADYDIGHHTQNRQKDLQDIRTHLRGDIAEGRRARPKAMFGTSTEVLAGLEKTFKDYAQKNEAAWCGPQGERAKDRNGSRTGAVVGGGF